MTISFVHAYTIPRTDPFFREPHWVDTVLLEVDRGHFVAAREWYVRYVRELDGAEAEVRRDLRHGDRLRLGHLVEPEGLVGIDSESGGKGERELLASDDGWDACERLGYVSG
jgi:hypothetical protein